MCLEWGISVLDKYALFYILISQHGYTLYCALFFHLTTNIVIILYQ